MLRFEKVLVHLHGNNKNHYKKLGIPYSKRGDSVWVYPEQVPTNSNVVLPAVCEYCYLDKPTKAINYWQYKRGITKKYCCDDSVCVSKHNKLKLLLSGRKHPDAKIIQLCEEKGLRFKSKFEVYNEKKQKRWYALCECLEEGHEVKVAFSNLQSKNKMNHCRKCSYNARSGPGNPSYNPNKTDKERAITRFPHYNRWKKAVKKADGNWCVVCGSPKRLEVHHLLRTDNLKLKAEPNNGAILCKSCHTGKDGYHHGFLKERNIKDFSPESFIDFLKSKENVSEEVVKKFEEKVVMLKIIVDQINSVCNAVE